MVMRISGLISNAVKSLIASLCVRFQLTEKFSMVSFRRMSHAHANSKISCNKRLQSDACKIGARFCAVYTLETRFV